MGETLTESDLAFLDAIRDGSSFRLAAERLHYTTHWAKKRSRQIRGRLGVETIEEALRMTETADGVSRGDFDKLVGLVTKLGESLEDLARAKPAEQPAAQQQVAQRELDVKDHAKALGLSMDDVKRVQDEKRYETFKADQARLEKERAEELEASGGGEPQRDGLGGIANLVRRAGNAE